MTGIHVEKLEDSISKLSEQHMLFAWIPSFNLLRLAFQERIKVQGERQECKKRNKKHGQVG